MIYKKYTKAISKLLLGTILLTGCGGNSVTNDKENSIEAIVEKDEVTKNSDLNNQDKDTRTLEDIQKQIEKTYDQSRNFTTSKLQITPNKKSAVVKINTISSGDRLFIYDINNKEKAKKLFEIVVDEETYIGDLKIIDDRKFKYSIKHRFKEPLRFTHDLIENKNISVNPPKNEDIQEIFKIDGKVLQYAYLLGKQDIVIAIEKDAKKGLYLYDNYTKKEKKVILDGENDKFSYFTYDSLGNGKLTYTYYESSSSASATKYVVKINNGDFKKGEVVETTSI